MTFLQIFKKNYHLFSINYLKSSTYTFLIKKLSHYHEAYTQKVVYWFGSIRGHFGSFGFILCVTCKMQNYKIEKTVKGWFEFIRVDSGLFRLIRVDSGWFGVIRRYSGWFFPAENAIWCNSGWFGLILCDTCKIQNYKIENTVKGKVSLFFFKNLYFKFISNLQLTCSLYKIITLPWRLHKKS